MRFVFTFLFSLNGVLAIAQDPKFSQYFASPLTQNPAYIGYFDGKYRFAMNTRKQWANVGDPFNTSSISAEYKLNDEYYYEDIFSVGVNGLFEDAFNGVLKTSLLGAGFSYYRFFDADHKVRFGLAPHISYVNKSLDYNRLTFASQYNNGVFNSALPNYISRDGGSIGYLDLNIGANLALAFENYNIYIGYSAFHLTRPNESNTNNYKGDLPIRHTIGLGFQYLTNDLLDFNLTAYRMTQGSSVDNVFGSILGFKPTYESKFKLNTGIWYKMNEGAYFPFLGFEIANYAVGINYTLLSNKINNVQPRTIELSIIITDKNFVKFKNTCKF